MNVTLRVVIRPRGKKTPHPVVTGKRIKFKGVRAVLNPGTTARKDPETEAYEAELSDAFVSAWPEDAGTPVGPIAADFLFVHPRPKRLMRKKDPAGVVAWNVAKPDWDNEVKSAQDALHKALSRVLGDDARVVLGRGCKVYAEKDGDPRVVVHVTDNLPSLEHPPLWLERLIWETPAQEWKNL